KGNRGDNNVAIGSHPPFLHFSSLLAFHAGVEGSRRVTRPFQVRGHALGRFLKSDVDDGSAGITASEAIQEQRVAILRLNRRGPYRQIGAVEPRHDRTLFRNSKSRTNVLNDRRRGGRRQSQYSLVFQFSRRFGQLEVVGP